MVFGGETFRFKADGLLVDEVEITANYSGIKFGPELEFFTVDGNLQPKNIIKKFQKLDLFGKNIKPELTNEQIEITAAPTASLRELEISLEQVLKIALETAEAYDTVLLPAALHPLSTDFTVFNNPRYHRIVEIFGPNCRLNAPRVTSAQINIGASNESEAFSIYNRLRCLLPIITGIAVASPIRDGKLGKCLSERMDIYNQTVSRYPEHTGFPQKLRNLDEYACMLRNLPVIQHPNSCYKYVRPMPQRGVAAEIRSLDEQPSLKEYLALVAIVKGSLPNVVLAEDMLERQFYKAVEQGIYDKKLFKRTVSDAANGLPASEQHYLEPLQRRLEVGTVADRVKKRFEDGEATREIFLDLAEHLRGNKAYI